MSNFTTWRSLVDGEEIAGIPDSAVHHYSVTDFTTSNWPDSEGNNDLNVNGLSADSTAFGGEGGVQGDGSDDYGESSPPNINPTEPWAVAFSFNTTGTGLTGFLDNDNNSGLMIGTGDPSNLTAGRMNLWLGHTGLSDTGDALQIGTSSSVDDGSDYKLILQNTGSNPSANDIEFYLDDPDSQASTNTANDNTIDGTVFNVSDFGHYARWREDSNTFEEYWSVVKSDIFWFNDSLNQSERNGVMDILP